MLPRSTSAIVLTSLAFFGLLAVTGPRWSRDRQAVRSGPRMVAEVIPLAQSCGYYYRSDQLNGELICRLVISDAPIAYERANLMRLGDPGHPSWAGTVAVSWPANRFLPMYDTAHSAVWGDLFLFGDPALIARLIAARGDD